MVRIYILEGKVAIGKAVFLKLVAIQICNKGECMVSYWVLVFVQEGSLGECTQYRKGQLFFLVGKEVELPKAVRILVLRLHLVLWHIKYFLGSSL
jgi:NhaP-type Na+/H+ and K+/H+ antiporter